MPVFIVIFVMFLLMIGLMAVGVMLKRKPISGSCGGLGNVGIEKACDCDKPCEKKLARLAESEQNDNLAASEYSSERSSEHLNEQTIHFDRDKQPKT